MKRRFYQSLLLALCILTTGYGVSSWAAFEAPPHSPADGYVVDTANILSPEGEARLEAVAENLDRTKHVQMALLTIDSLQGESLEETSLNIARTWGVGYKEGGGTGLFMLMVVKDRKFRTEVGPGLQGEITDGYTGQVTDTVLLPAFRAGQYDAGFLSAFETYSQRLGAPPLATAGAPNPPSTTDVSPEVDALIEGYVGLVSLGAFSLVFLPIIGVVLLILLLSLGRPRYDAHLAAGNKRVTIRKGKGFWSDLLLWLLVAMANSRSSGGGSSGSDFGSSSSGGGSSFGGGDFDGGGSSRDW